jgi:hypothetical protein
MFYFFTSFDVFCFTFDVFAFDVFVHLMLKTSNAHVLSKSCQGDWSLPYEGRNNRWSVMEEQ